MADRIDRIADRIIADRIEERTTERMSVLLMKAPKESVIPELGYERCHNATTSANDIKMLCDQK